MLRNVSPVCLAVLFRLAAPECRWLPRRDIIVLRLSLVRRRDAVSSNRAGGISDSIHRRWPCVGRPGAPKRYVIENIDATPASNSRLSSGASALGPSGASLGMSRPPTPSSILGDDTTVYVSQYIDPAFFGPGDIKREIERLSQLFGSSAAHSENRRSGLRSRRGGNRLLGRCRAGTT